MTKRKRKGRKERQNRLEKYGIGSGNSRYRQKVDSGKQMYGDGKRCCGHRFTKVSMRRMGSDDGT